jgi:hypothetical protein
MPGQSGAGGRLEACAREESANDLRAMVRGLRGSVPGLAVAGLAAGDSVSGGRKMMQRVKIALLLIVAALQLLIINRQSDSTIASEARARDAKAMRAALDALDKREGTYKAWESTANRFEALANSFRDTANSWEKTANRCISTLRSQQ